MNSKKILSLVLAGAMTMSSVTVAFAAPADVKNEKQIEAVDALMALNVVNGYEDGSFKPENTVTRAEMAKLLVEALGYKDLVEGSSSSFADAKGTWYEGHIAIAEGLGILNGYPDGTVKGNNPVSYQEAVVMILRTLGYNDMGVNKGVDRYNATAYKTKASAIGILDDVAMVAGGANRGDAAVMLYNALDCTMVSVDKDGNVTEVTDKNEKDKATILLDKLAKQVKLTVTPDDLDDDHLVDLAPYMLENITAYTNDDDEIVFVKESNSDVKKGEAESITGGIKVDGKKFTTYAEEGKTVVNNAYTKENVSDLTTLDEVEVKVVYNKAGEIEGLVYDVASGHEVVTENYKSGRTYITVENSKVYLPTDSDDEIEKLTVKGAVDSLEDIKEDDVLSIFVAQESGYKSSSSRAERMTIIVTRNTVEGTVRVESTNSANKIKDVTVNGTKYKFVDEAMSTKSLVGDDYKLYLNEEGKIVKAELVESKTISDYAVIKEIKDGYKAGSVSVKEPKLVIATANGETITYELDEDELTKYVNQTNYSVEGLAVGQVILFDTNSDNEIDEITVKGDAGTDLEDLVSEETGTEIDTTKKSFKLADKAIIYYVEFDGEEIDEISVIDAEKLGDNITVSAYRTNDDGEYELLVVTDKGNSDVSYAIIDSVKKATNDDGDKVQYVTLYINGEERTVYTDDDKVFDMNNISYNTPYEIEFSGSEITKATKLEEKDYVGVKEDLTITSVNGTRFKVGSTWYDLADNYGIYVFDEDGDFDYIGETGDLDLDGYTATIYDLNDDNDEDEGYEMVVLQKVKEVKEEVR